VGLPLRSGGELEHLSDVTAPLSTPTPGVLGPVILSPGPPIDPVRTPGGFVVELESFSGPLDLLLHLLREEQIEIADIPIARIADQFLAAIHDLGLNQAADYLELASRLVRLKAQMLLPRGAEGEEWDDPRAELVRRLLEYQQIKEIAHWMGEAVERRALRLARGYLPPAPALPPPPLTLDLADLLAAVERVIAGILHPVLHRVVARPLDVEGAERRIEELLEARSSFAWTEALPNPPTLSDVLSVLLALLELARRGACSIRQLRAFGPLMVHRESALPTA
jgi:segregation and condensation protein A